MSKDKDINIMKNSDLNQISKKKFSIYKRWITIILKEMEKDCYNKQKTIIIMKVEKSGQKIHYHNNGGKEKKFNITNTIRHIAKTSS